MGEVSGAQHSCTFGVLLKVVLNGEISRRHDKYVETSELTFGMFDGGGECLGSVEIASSDLVGFALAPKGEIGSRFLKRVGVTAQQHERVTSGRECSSQCEHVRTDIALRPSHRNKHCNKQSSVSLYSLTEGSTLPKEPPKEHGNNASATRKGRSLAS